MSLKKAVFFGTVLWVLIFFEVSILMFGFKLSPGAIFYAIHYIALALLVSICTLIYSKHSKLSTKNGFITGIIFALTTTILDALITVPLFVKDYSFFLDKFLWIGTAEVIIITAFIGMIKSRI